MDDQKYLQARNCITNYCFYPRTAATQLVERMTQGEVEQILRVADPVDKPADEKKVGIDKILADCQKRWEKEASQRASRVMEQQKTLHAAEQVPAGEPIEELDPADHLMTFILSEETLEELGVLIVDVSDDTLDKVARFAVQLKEACDLVRAGRKPIDEPSGPNGVADQDASEATPQTNPEEPPANPTSPQETSGAQASVDSDPSPESDPPPSTPETPGVETESSAPAPAESAGPAAAAPETPAPAPSPGTVTPAQVVPGPANPPRPDKPNEVA